MLIVIGFVALKNKSIPKSEYNFDDTPIYFDQIQTSKRVDVQTNDSNYTVNNTNSKIEYSKSGNSENGKVELVNLEVKNRQTIGMQLVSSTNLESSLDSQNVEFMNSTENFKITYSTFENFVKEEITLLNENSTKQFIFELNSNNQFDLVKTNEGGINILQNGRLKYYIYPLTAKDNAGNVISFEYEVKEHSITIKPINLTQFKDAVYPIVIDPTIAWVFSNSVDYTVSDAAKIEVAGGVVRLIDDSGYSIDNPYVISNKTLIYTTLSSFSETLGSNNQGSIQYQITNNGTDWYWWNGSAWTLTTADYTESNSASDLNANIANFPTDVGTGALQFKAFLHAPTNSDQVELEAVNIEYFSDTAPTITSLSSTTGSTVGETDITINGSNFDTTGGTKTYAYTGSDQIYTVPAGVTSIRVKMWGAGGGGGGRGSSWTHGYDGGGGGYTTADIAVTPGQVLTVMVGAGGQQARNIQTGYNYGGGGPNCNTGGDCYYGGGGGGRSAIRVSGEDILTAGGGGGGGTTNIANYFENGGGGGGLTGQDGLATGNIIEAGHGGTQNAGGAAGSGNNTFATAGQKYLGGYATTQSYGSGGGGGWYGGGGGAYRDNGMGGGGGGSSYIDGAGVSNATTVAANRRTQAYAFDLDNGGAGYGGYGADIGTNGTPGKVIIDVLPKTVTVDGITARNIRVVDANTIIATIPTHAAGAVDVVVTNPDGQSATLNNGYTYVAPTVTSLSSNSGSTNGGTDITISGTNFEQGVKTQIYEYTGADQTYTVPVGVTSIRVKMWGAGGGGGYKGGWTYGYIGGGGGYTEADLAVTPGQVLTVMVGAAGVSGSTPITTSNYGGGGQNCSGADCQYGGSGGGRSAIRLSSDDILTAGGGGGGGSTYGVSGLFDQNGGGGGGSTAEDGKSISETYAAGKGGTQVSGGAGGSGSQRSGTSGEKYLGGKPGGTESYGGAGGGGYFGGGGGAYYNYMGGGGGGSSYIGGAGVSNAINLGASSRLSANTIDTLANNAGMGGLVNANGQPGRVIIDILPKSVTFGGTAATNVRFTDSNTIVATIPAHIAGTVDVVVTNSDGNSATLTNGYTYIAPTVTSISPNTGVSTGGTDVTITGTDFTNNILTTTFTYNQTDQTYIVPEGVTSIKVKMWGAGGAGGTTGGWPIGFYGGGGGYTEGEMDVTPGQVITVVAGGPGLSAHATANSTQNTYGGGGSLCATEACNYGSQGGGRSAIKVNGDDVLTAGGGGGGGAGRDNNIKQTGGGGGGLVGQRGLSEQILGSGGGGGTQSSGGVAGASYVYTAIAGTKYSGGYQHNGAPYGGTGGGGWYGGGAGAYQEANTMGGGGGGSSYADSGLIYNTRILRGDLNVQANNTDSDNGGAGAGGAPNTNGASGKVIIQAIPNKIKFDGVEATNVKYINSTTITATIPAHAIGTVDVTVTNSNGFISTLVGGFTFTGPITSSVTPSTGSTFGGTKITIGGQNFTKVEPQIFDFDNTTQTYTVPDGVTSINVKMWGAGGGGSNIGAWTNTHPGGAGGYTNANIDVTPGQVLSVIVGGGGHDGTIAYGGSSYGGGGASCIGGADCRYSAQGGGRSSIYYDGDDLLTAGGGGGAGVTSGSADSQAGGGGGGLFGENGHSQYPYVFGLGGSYKAGGLGGQGNSGNGTNGSKFQGGTPGTTAYGGGGGGGYYGGGGGGFKSGGIEAMGGGGGGSSYIFGTGVKNAVTLAAVGSTQPEASDTYNAGFGAGGAPYYPGKSGRVVITPNPIKVEVGGVEATQVTYVDNSTITAVVPVNSSGTKDVVITNSDGVSNTLADGFTYVGSQLTSITPTFGSTSGGTDVTIEGTNLTASLESQTYNYVARDQTYIVPEGVTSIFVKTWGGGGGGGDSLNWGNGYSGGGGGFASGEIPVTPGQVIKVVVGAGGAAGRTDFSRTSYGYNGVCTGDCNYGGQGGGLSGVFDNTTEMIIAGGGGGGGVSRSNVLSQIGGAGGGLVGEDGISQSVVTAGGKGGTQSMGGAAGSAGGGNGSSGTKFYGGNTYQSYGGTGGGGYYGGGAGSYQETLTMGGGGGGSSFIGYAGILNPLTIAGSSNLQGNLSDPDNGDAGAGGAVNQPGKPGKVIITAAPSTVKFGTEKAENVTLVDENTITAITPANTEGLKDVILTTPDGQDSTLPDAFTFIPPPQITNISPAFAAIDGGTEMTFTGTYFADTPTITFDGVAATSVTYVNINTLTVVAPAHALGKVDIVITNPNGDTSTFEDGVEYIKALAKITSITPNLGPTDGGTSLNISGENFVADKDLLAYWDLNETSGSNADEISKGSDTTLDGTITGSSIVNGHSGKARQFSGSDTFTTTTNGLPIGYISNFSISVWASSQADLNSWFLQTFPRDDSGVNRISMHFPWNADNTLYFDFGNAFSGRIAIPWNIGWTNQMAHWVFTSEYGVGHKIYRNGVLVGSNSTSAQFYNDDSTTWKIGPWSGIFDELKLYTRALSEQEVIDDYNSSGVKVNGSLTIGGVNVNNLTYINNSTLTATTPAHAPGTFDVVLNQSDGQTDRITNGFLFANAPTITNINPTVIYVAGGDTVTITGTNFEEDTQVLIGGGSALSVDFINSTTLIVVAPPHPVGYVDVKVVNTSTLEYTLLGELRYLNPPPTITSVNPTSGENTGGTPVTITGTNFDKGGEETGNGEDGAVVISSNKNINTDTIATGRTCADAINYSVTNLTNGGATVSTVPVEGCLVTGDEILLINMQGTDSSNVNVGNYETLRVSTVTDNTISFTTGKTKFYGDGVSDDNNIGTTTNTQKVMIQRVPNYTDVTINASVTLTASAWNGTKGGVLLFKSTGTVTNNGTIDMNAKGFRGGNAGVYAPESDIGFTEVNGGGGGGGGGGHEYSCLGGLGADGADNGGSSCGSGNGGGTGANGGGGGGTGGGWRGPDGGGFGGNGSTGGTGGSGGPTEGGNGSNGGGGGASGAGRDSGGGGGGGKAYDSLTNNSPESLNKIQLGGGASAGAGGGAGGGAGDYKSANGGSGGSKNGQGGLRGTDTCSNNSTAGSNGQNGGAGGGIIFIYAPTFNNSGSITSAGGNGGNGGSGGIGADGCGTGGSGGGGGGGNGASGGSILLKGKTLSLGNNLIAATGGGSGSGGNGGNYPYTAGNGASGTGGTAGKVAVYYSESASGTTNPSTYLSVDSSLSELSNVVKFGNTQATSVQYVNSTTLVAITPAHINGTVDVTLTNSSLQTATLTNGFSFVDPPTITNINPNIVYKDGGNTVTITGSYFDDTPQIIIGGVPATSVTYVNSTTLSVVVPAHTLGTVNVKIINPSGLNSTYIGGLTYVNQPPTITSIDPTEGENTGGTSVTITGTNFSEDGGELGTGADGEIIISDAKNINTDAIADGRTCADAINYSVTALTSTTANLFSTPSSDCLSVGDEVLLINLQGTGSHNGNVGNYEYLRIASISTNIIEFTTSKTKNYGDGSNDLNIGTSSTNQKVMLQRIPNYTDVEVQLTGTLTASPWDGVKGGVLMFKSRGNLIIDGLIDLSGKGYRGGQGLTNGSDYTQGESYAGIGFASTVANIGGGGVGTGEGSVYNGTSSSGGGGASYGDLGTDGVLAGGTTQGSKGNTYGINTLEKIYLGSGGGGGGAVNYGGGSGTVGGNGGAGGGLGIILSANLNLSGNINSNGSKGVDGNSNGGYGGSGGGGGSGGSLRIESLVLNISTSKVNAAGGAVGVGGAASEAGTDGGSGGVGRVALYSDSISGTSTPSAFEGSASLSSIITVEFGGSFASNVHLVNSTTLTAVTPAHANGLVDLIVHNGNGLVATLTDAFTFVDPIQHDATIAPKNFTIQKIVTSSAPDSETYDLKFDWNLAQFATKYNLYRSTNKTTALFQDTCSINQIQNNHRAGELSSVAPLCETTLQQNINVNDTTSWVKMAVIADPINTYTIDWSTIQSTLTNGTYYFVLRSENDVNESAYSTMVVAYKGSYTNNASLANTNWISIPYNSPYTKASDIVSEIEGGTDANRNVKLNTVTVWRPNNQSVESFKYNSILQKWVGTDFDINAGDGISLILSGNTSAFNWTVAGNDTVNQRTFSLNLTKPNQNWISMPLTTKVSTASDIVNIIEGGVGSNTNQKITSISVWNAATQTTTDYSYDSGLGAWSGTNFAINPGDGISILLSGNSSSVNFTPYLVINPNQ